MTTSMIARAGRGLSAGLLIVGSLLLGFGAQAPPAGAELPPLSCTISADPSVLPAGGGNVTFSGTGPGSTVLTILVNGFPPPNPPGPLTVTTDAAGNFSFVLHITVTSTIAVSSVLYPIDCDPEITVEVPRGGGGGGSTPGGSKGGQGQRGFEFDRELPAGGRLAFTGANNTLSMVYIGFAAAAIGMVLVVAVRRRRSLHGRI